MTIIPKVKAIARRYRKKSMDLYFKKFRSFNTADFRMVLERVGVAANDTV